MTTLTSLQRSVVERIQAGNAARDAAKRASAAASGRLGGPKSGAWHHATRELAPELRGTATSRSRVAARYAMLANVTLTAAAEVFELSRHTVSVAWAKVYPGVPGAVCRRRR